MEWIVTHYLWIKAIHLMAVFAWMAGLFYLPRLFVYHALNQDDNVILHEQFMIMERRLFKGIMNPAMILSWLCGGLLIAYHIHLGTFHQGWLHLKLMMVVILTIMHKMCFFHLKRFVTQTNQKSHVYFRVFNEIPTLCLIVIVICVIVQPF